MQALYAVPVERHRGVGEPDHAHHESHQVHALLRALLLQSLTLTLLSPLRLSAEWSSCAQAARAVLLVALLRRFGGLPSPDCGWAHGKMPRRRLQGLFQHEITQDGPATVELWTATVGQSSALLACSQCCRHGCATAKLSFTCACSPRHCCP